MTERLKQRIVNYIGLGVALMMLMALFATTFIIPAHAASKNASLIVFTADWCANCRDVVPVVQNLSVQKGVRMNLIDVDASNAPKQAKQFGLDIPTRDLPQIYLQDAGQTRLIFDSSGYVYGQTELVRTALMQYLQ